jgi:flagellar protein FlaG
VSIETIEGTVAANVPVSNERIDRVAKEAVAETLEHKPVEIQVEENAEEITDKLQELSEAQKRELEETLKNVKKFSGENLDFSVHEATKQLFVTVTDKETGRIVKQLPSEDLLDLRSRMQQMVKGLLLDAQS